MHPRDMRYIFAGNDVDYETYKHWIALRDKGICPFCKRTGLSNRYGSKMKHIAACKDNPKK